MCISARQGLTGRDADRYFLLFVFAYGGSPGRLRIFVELDQ